MSKNATLEKFFVIDILMDILEQIEESPARCSNCDSFCESKSKLIIGTKEKIIKILKYLKENNIEM